MRKILIASVSLNVFLASAFLLRDGDLGAVAALGAPGHGGGSTPSENGDVNCDGRLDLSDAVYILGYLFLGTAAPCAFECVTTPVCGDGIVEGNELCDGANLNGHTCEEFGFEGGMLTCNGNCDLDASACESASTCGNGIIEGVERCDGANLGGHTCEELGFAGGMLTCNGNCDLDTSACEAASTCGNGTVEGNERCDGADFSGRTCQDFGFETGFLSCTACDIDTSGCR